MAFTREQIEEELFYILSESYCFNEEQTIEDIRASSSLIQDLGMDSIQVLEFIVEIEKRFSYVCEPEELELSIFDNFNTLVDFVLSKKQLN